MIEEAQLQAATIQVPTGMLPYITMAEDAISFKQRALLLYPYVQDGGISYGRAAEILGISKWSLIQLYGSLGIPYIDMGQAEFERDVSVALAAAQ